MTDSLEPEDVSAPDGCPIFERVLRPHRSLPRRSFRLLMLVIGLLSLSIGVRFVAIGAWPVLAFCGLDVALVYVAFRLNYRSARRSETVRLAGDSFTVERVSVRGHRRVWRFQPFWLRVILEEHRDEFKSSVRRLAWAQPRGRRLSRVAGAARAGRDNPRGAAALAQFVDPGGGLRPLGGVNPAVRAPALPSIHKARPAGRRPSARRAPHPWRRPHGWSCDG